MRNSVIMIREQIDKVVGKIGLIRTPSWWMRWILLRLLDMIDNVTSLTDKLEEKKQNKSSNNLTTEAKTIVPAINELDNELSTTRQDMDQKIRNAFIAMDAATLVFQACYDWTQVKDEWGNIYSYNNYKYHYIRIRFYAEFPKYANYAFEAKVIGGNNNILTLASAFYSSGGSRLSKIEFVDFNTSRVRSTNSMFDYCPYLREVPLFDTSSVTDMSRMFMRCNQLQNVPLYNTSKVEDMSYMFGYCVKLPTIPLFNTIRVTTMEKMFSTCRLLEEIPLLDTSNVTNMSYMFQECEVLPTIPQLNTSKVTNMLAMFYGCLALSEMPDLDYSQVTNMGSTFYSTSLTSMSLSIPSVTDMHDCFLRCGSLTELVINDANNLVIANRMCSMCRSLTSFTMPSAPALKEADAMFYYCDQLPSISFPEGIVLLKARSMFSECRILPSITVPDLSQVEDLSNLFYDCFALTTITGLKTDSATSLSQMFSNCQSLTEIPSMNTAHVESWNNTFSACFVLKTIPRLDMGACTSADSIMRSTYGIVNLGGFDNLKLSITSNFLNNQSGLTKQSLLNVIDGLWDFTNNPLEGYGDTHQVAFGATNIAKLTADEIALATAKGWELI